MKLRLWAEFLILYFGLITVYALLDSPGSPIPPLLVFGLAAYVYLRRRPDFDRARFTRRGPLKHIVLRWAVVAIVLIAAVAILRPEHLFDLPRNNPLIWGLVAVFYPLLSVYRRS
jgi:CAAX protease family protein